MKRSPRTIASVLSLVFVFACCTVAYSASPLWQVPVSSQPDSVAPAVAQDGTIYFTVSEWPSGSNMQIHAVNANGTVKWATNAKGLNPGPFMMVGPDGTLYLPAIGPSQDEVLAVDSTGKSRWRFPVGGGAQTHIGANDRSGNLYWLVRTYVQPNQYRTTLYALDSNGGLRWKESKVGGAPRGGATPPSIAISASGDIYAEMDIVRLFDRTGAEKWSADVLPVTNFALDDNSRLYFGGVTDQSSRTGFLYCYDALGAKQWQSSLAVYASIPKTTPLLSSDGLLVVNFSSPDITVLNTNGQLIRSGFNTWSSQSAVALLTGTNVVDGVYRHVLSYVGTEREGLELPKFEGNWYSSPVTSGPNGVIYFTAFPVAVPGKPVPGSAGLFAFETGRAIQNSPWPQEYQNASHSGQMRAQAAIAPEIRLIIEQAIALKMTTVAGTSYRAQESKDLTNWANIGGRFLGNGGIMTNFFIPSSQSLFYRMRVEP